MEKAIKPWVNVPPVDKDLQLNSWINSLSDEKFGLLELLADKVREQAFNEVVEMMENSQLAQLLKPQPRKSFRLLKVKSFKLV